jgi:hypothetical protein
MAIVTLAIEQPAFGQVRVANELRKRGLAGSRRRRALCVAAPRPRDDEQAAQGAGSQERPGGAGADRGAGHRAGKGQDREGGARRVRERASGLLRRSGHLLCRQSEGCWTHLQQTFIDTYTKVSLPNSTIAKCRSRRPISSMTACCHSLSSTMSSCCAVLTDRGSESCGNPERHEYELYLAVENIDQTKSPQGFSGMDIETVARADSVRSSCFWLGNAWKPHRSTISMRGSCSMNGLGAALCSRQLRRHHFSGPVYLQRMGQ